MIKITRKSSSGRTVHNHLIYFDENPHPQSWAARLLLKNELRFQDVDYLADELWVWLEFREKYLKKVLAEKGELVCVYCGKRHLEIGGRTPEELEKNNKNPNLATVDHITALINGGEKYNEKNMCVSCKKCNGKKDDKPVEAFKDRLQKNKNKNFIQK